MAVDNRTHPPDCDCAVCEAARGGVDAEGQRMLRELDLLRTTVPGQRIEGPDPEPAGGGCGCGCWFAILLLALLAVVIVGAVGYWQGFLPEVIEDRIPFTGGSDNGERDDPDSTRAGPGPHCHRRGRHGGVHRTTLRVYERLRRRPGHSGRLLQCHQRRRLDGQHELVERCPHRTVVRRSHRRQRTRSVVAAPRQWAERDDP